MVGSELDAKVNMTITFPLRKPRSGETADMPYGDHAMAGGMVTAVCTRVKVRKRKPDNKVTEGDPHPYLEYGLEFTGRSKWT